MSRMNLSLDGTTLEASADNGNKQWVAVITDTHPTYNLERDFVAYQKPKTSDRASGTATVEDGDVVESVHYSHGGKEKGRTYYQVLDGDLHEIDADDVETALDELVVEVEEDDDDDQTEEAELLTDGGEDVDLVSDDEIESRIRQHDDPDHPDAATVDEVRDLLPAINADVLEWWDEHQDTIDDGGYEIVHEDSEAIVLADHSGYFWGEQFDALDVDDDVLRTIITSLHHDAAGHHTDYNWSAVYPIVIAKPPLFQAGETHVLREIARRAQETGGMSRAVDQYATEVHGWSNRNWAALTGRHESTVSRTTRPKSDE